MSDLLIRSASGHAELHACVDLQIQVWSFPPKDAVPFNQLHAAHEWGGQVLVALDGAQVVGFCYGFAGRQAELPALCSHMLAVLPAYRGRDLGAQLKLAQGRWALDHGYELITWTYDPLEAVNARLNITRLGGVARQYLVDHYGRMPDGLNQGMPSDRLLLEWHLHDPAVRRILAGEQPEAEVGADPLRVTFPRAIQHIKLSDPAEALRWRLQVREQIQGALAAGYLITGVELIGGDQAQYLLTKERSHVR